jgi:hypothetical protein
MKLEEWSEYTELLKDYWQRQDELKTQILKTGEIPDEVIDKSPCREYQQIEELSDEEKELVETFLDWYRKNDVSGFHLAEVGGYKVKYSKKSDEPGGADFEHSKNLSHNSKLTKFFKKFAHTADSIKIRDDIDLKSEDAISYAKKEVRRYRDAGHNHRFDTPNPTGIKENLIFCPESYREEINQTKCGCLSKEGKVFNDKRCGWKYGLFVKMAEDRGFDIQDINLENVVRQGIKFYLPEDEVVISQRGINDEVIEGYDPNLLVILSEPSNIIQYLEYDCDILVISEEGSRFINADREVEGSIEEMINRLVRDLTDKRKEMQGKEHTRIQKAMKELGQDIGYFPDEEIGISGLRADVAWRKRENGNVVMCGEIETSGGWKKDLLSTWETQPELAVLITTSHKTNKVAKDLAKLYVMDEMPHQFLYLNFKTGDAFLFDGNDPLAKYQVGEDIHEEAEKSFSIEEI